MENKMFCYQCQEASGGKGCTSMGVCGKTPVTAELLDKLVFATKVLCEITDKLRSSNMEVPKNINRIITENLFVTITNVNFDNSAIESRIRKTYDARTELLKLIPQGTELSEPAVTDPDAGADGLGVLSERNDDIRSLKELITYGIKGMAAYMHHADVLGYDDDELDAFMQRALASLLDSDISVEKLIQIVSDTGKYGVKAMELLDRANTETYGAPEVTRVNIGTRDNPGILVSGHDLKDLEMLLKQTEGKGVDVYTHSEMLPAHYYPAFKKYSHFAGNYGNAWWKQRSEFESFNGPVLMTTNCLVPPSETYRDRVYTTGAAGFEGCRHIEADENGEKDFSELIEHARKCSPPKQIESGEIVGGFAHNQVMAVSDRIVEAVKSGAIRKFVVMAGCDGRSGKRDYYTEFAKRLPHDTVILTAGCAKYRYNKLELGEICGIPRVLDAGQCNDSYSLALTALNLKKAFGLDGINDLPIVYNISWYEQKAVIVLLALLYLGVKNICLGPTLPAFLTPATAKFLTETYGIRGISSVDEDIEAMVGQ